MRKDWNLWTRSTLMAALACVALVALTSCGGGGSGGSPPVTVIPPTPTPTQLYYGALSSTISADRCSVAFGVAVDRTSKSDAESTAVNLCRSNGGRERDCAENVVEFGNKYSDGHECVALVYGNSANSTGCPLRTLEAGYGNSITSAVSDALSKCDAKGYLCSHISGSNGDLAVGCATGNALRNAFSGVFTPGTPSTPDPPPGNRAPTVVQGLRDSTVQQGGTLTYRDINDSFSDPDGDRLTISASSNSLSHATARVSGGDLIIKGVKGFTQGSVTITVTARDPSGLTASLTFAVRVSLPDNRAPTVVKGPRDSTVQQGGTLTYRDINDSFSDPDGDRLTISASSNSLSHATARVSGGDLIIKGVKGFTQGSVTITVTARDPSGLTASLTFDVRVSLPQYFYGAISFGWKSIANKCADGYASYIAWDYPDQNSADSSALESCRNRGGRNCIIAKRFGSGHTSNNQCGALAFAENSTGCQAFVGAGSTESNARSQALSSCRNAGFTSCSISPGEKGPQVACTK